MKDPTLIHLGLGHTKMDYERELWVGGLIMTQPEEQHPGEAGLGEKKPNYRVPTAVLKDNPCEAPELRRSFQRYFN